MSGEAVVCRISVRPHFNEKYTNIQLGQCLGHDVIVGKAVQEGELGIYFDTDSQLSEKFCLDNGLLRKHPVTGEQLGGYLETSRRVRAIKLCEIKSDGLWLPLASLSGVDTSVLKEGDRFQSLAGVDIVQKYYTPATARALFRGGSQQARPTFPKHYETPKLKELINLLHPPFTYIVTEKLHGTSQRQAYQLEDYTTVVPWKFVEENGGLVCATTTEKRWQHLLGTRNVVIGKILGGDFVTKESYRSFWANKLKHLIHKNEVLYYEIVGYSEGGTPIMGDQPTSRLKNKEMEEKYGSTMHYSYGCAAGNSQAYLYRVVIVNEDGKQFEMPWDYVSKRAVELGIPLVPVLKIQSMLNFDDDYNKTLIKNLGEEMEQLCVGPSTLCHTHIREGVCLRVEGPRGIRVMKHKSWDFGVLEGYLKENDDYVDSEEVS